MLPRVVAFLRARAWVLLCILMGALTLSVMPLMVDERLDSSWIMALNVARATGMQFGPDILFTYGPLGFATHPVALSGVNIVIGILWVVGSASLFQYALFQLTRAIHRARVRALTVVLASVALVFMSSPERALLAVILLSFVLVRQPPHAGRARLSLCVFLGVAWSVLVLVKFSFVPGLVFVVLGSVTSTRRLRDASVSIASAALSLPLLWVALGQHVGHLPGWLRDSFDISQGFSQNMSSGPADASQWIFVVAGMVAGILLTVRVSHHSRPTAAMVFLALTLAFRQSFTRFDAGHAAVFFVTLAVLTLAAHPVGPRVAGFVVASFAIATTFRVVDSPHNPMSISRVVDKQRTALRQMDRAVRLTFDTDARHTLVTNAFGYLQNKFDIPDDIIRRIGSSTVHVEPFDVSAAIVYGLRWHPTPVFQSYAAYTAHLDQKNARFIRTRGPRLILATTDSVDVAFVAWQSPATHLEMACRYRQVAVGERWRLFQRGPTICGTPQLVRTVALQNGTAIALPPADDHSLLYATFSLPEGAFSRLYAALYRPRSIPRITVFGSTFRLGRGTAELPHLVVQPETFQGRTLPYWGFSASEIVPRGVPSGSTVQLWRVPLLVR